MSLAKFLRTPPVAASALRAVVLAIEPINVIIDKAISECEGFGTNVSLKKFDSPYISLLQRN